MKANNHHGHNPVLGGLSGQGIRAILKREAAMRAAGDWGQWEHLGPREFDHILGQRSGWVRDVHAVHRNKVFSVLERKDESGVTHAGIASLSGIRPTWYEMQRIKDELFGSDKTAVEIYPPKSEIVDGSDMFHVWVLRNPLKFGLTRLGASRGAAGIACEVFEDIV